MLESASIAKLFRTGGIVAIALLFGGCFDNDPPAAAGGAAATAAAPAQSPSSSTHAAPISLAGIPPTVATVGVNYSFRPTVSQSSGAVTFSVTGQPSWMGFDTGTGALTGAPTAKDEGTTGHIVISASNAGVSASLTPFTVQVKGATANSQPAPTGSVRLSWVAPTQNTDGTPITDLAGYRIYFGTSAEELTDSIDVVGAQSTTYVVENLPAGTYYFAVTAYSTAGIDSGESNLASDTI
jgi:putative Ig domain-containing protein